MTIPSGTQHQQAVTAAIQHRLTRNGCCSYCAPHGTVEEGPAGATWTVPCEHGGIRQEAERYINAYLRFLAERDIQLVGPEAEV